MDMGRIGFGVWGFWGRFLGTPLVATEGILTPAQVLSEDNVQASGWAGSG